MSELDCLAGTGDLLPMIPLVIALLLVAVGLSVAVARRVRGRRRSIAAAVGSVLALALIVPMLALAPVSSASAADGCPPPPPPPPTAPCEPTVAIDAPVVSFRYTALGEITGTLDEAWLTAFIAAGGTFATADFTGTAAGVLEAQEFDGTVLGSQSWEFQSTGPSSTPPTINSPTTVVFSDTGVPDNSALFLQGAGASWLDATNALSAQFPDAPVILDVSISYISTWTLSGSYSDGCSAQSIAVTGPFSGGGGGNN